MTLFEYDSSGFDELEKVLKEYADRASKEELQQVLLAAADEYVSDLLKLPKPKSGITKPGYTHLIDTFADRANPDGSVAVGWGKRYGLFLERGTTKMAAQPHMRPNWEQNAARYYTIMTEHFHKGA